MLAPRPDSEVAESPDDFRYQGYSGLVVLTTSFSESDPEQTLRGLRIAYRDILSSTPRCLALRQRLGDVTSTFDEELRQRAQRPVLERDDSD